LRSACPCVRDHCTGTQLDHNEYPSCTAAKRRTGKVDKSCIVHILMGGEWVSRYNPHPTGHLDLGGARSVHTLCCSAAPPPPDEFGAFRVLRHTHSTVPEACGTPPQGVTAPWVQVACRRKSHGRVTTMPLVSTTTDTKGTMLHGVNAIRCTPTAEGQTPQGGRVATRRDASRPKLTHWKVRADSPLGSRLDRAECIR
jgi:hypothetical protein